MEKPQPKTFTPPSIDDCTKYGTVIGLPGEECMAFYDYQLSIGWKVGKHPMKDWQAAMRTWKRNNDKWEPRQSRQSVKAQAPVPLFAQIQSLKELISKSRANTTSAYYTDKCTPEEKQKLKEWRAALNQINEQQARGNHQ